MTTDASTRLSNALHRRYGDEGISSIVTTAQKAIIESSMPAVRQALDRINQRNTALLGQIGSQASQAVLASQQPLASAAVQQALDQINQRNTALLGEIGSQIAAWTASLPRLDVDGLDAQAAAQFSFQAFASLDHRTLGRAIGEIAGVAEPSPASEGVLDWLNSRGLSPDAQRRLLVSFVWLVVFLPLATLATENYEDAKILSVILGVSAYSAAKDGAAATDKAVKKLQGGEQ